jgi:hypothetical protein
MPAQGLADEFREARIILDQQSPQCPFSKSG